jgi:single-strand DNA-binding protein
MAKSLNRVQLIGNLTRDPELRYTPQGTAVCSFSIATNRNWTTDTGEKKDEVEFHRIVAWAKLAELCSQFLVKGRKVFVEGRLTTRSWTAQDGTQKQTTEIIISDMILLDSKRPDVVEPKGEVVEPVEKEAEEKTSAKQNSKSKNKVETPEEAKEEEEIVPDDIPF